jgi:phosphosulfolactate phosphohydrolase-like enzyme
VILCAGRERAFALDDAYAAGRLLTAVLGGGRKRKGLNDAALASLDLVRRYGTEWERPLRASRGGSDLVTLGFDADVVDAARQDAYPVLPVYHERRITAAPPPASLL